MTPEKIILFLGALHANQITPSGQWVKSCCPLAPWTHKTGHDSNPSFGVSVAPGARSYYNCFSCGKGSLEELLHVMEMHSLNSPHYNFAACHALLDEEKEVMPLPEYAEVHTPAQVFSEWPEYCLSKFSPATAVPIAMEYLLNRGVDAADAALYRLQYDYKKEMVVFPYWDVYGRLAGARGRSIMPGVEGTSKHYDYTFQGVNNCRYVWYGEEVLNTPGAVVIVEGQFDRLRVRKAHNKTLANLTAQPTWEKMKKLSDCPKIIQIPDNDAAGDKSVRAYAELAKKLGVKHVVLQLGAGVKDPAECAVEYLAERIKEFV